MRAVVFDAPGGPEVLRIGELPDPAPGPQDLLVRNFAAGVNRADILQRRGRYPPPPGAPEVLGLEFAGEVVSAGAGVPGFERGDRVFGLVAGGGYAELVAVHHRLALPIPETLSFEGAAALPEAFMTAGENLFELGGLRPGDRVLVHAGASGVGSAAIQLARDAGIDPIATASTPEKRARCVALGASLALDYREDFAEAVLAATGGRGVDAVLDLVGGSHLERNLRCLAPGGRLLLVGLVGGARAEADLGAILRKGLRVIGSTLRGKSLEEKAAVAERFRARVLPRVEAGGVKPVLDRVYLIEDVRQAHERMERNESVGKIVLRM